MTLRVALLVLSMLVLPVAAAGVSGVWEMTLKIRRQGRMETPEVAPARIAVSAVRSIRDAFEVHSRAMRISDLLLTEFDAEVDKTRKTLERVPAGKGDYAPHSKSMPLGRLAPHIAQLSGFGLTILTEPEFDFAQRNISPLPFESAEQLVRVFDEGSAVVRNALQNTADETWNERWKLSAGPRTIFEATRFLAFRQMYINHIVHHRAQLGVYLRLNDEPVPSTYGPSADETLGF